LLTQLTCALYWFNPLVWLAAHDMRSEREQACDDLVVSAGARPTSYAEEILRIAAGHSTNIFEPCGAIAMARPSRLEGRLLAILDDTRNRRTLSPLATTTAMLLLTAVLIPVSMLHSELSPPVGQPELPQAQLRQAEDLVAWWRAEGNAADSVGAHDGKTPFGSRFAEGIVGQAFDFTRNNTSEHALQRISVPDSPSFQLVEAMTLEAWIYPRRYGGIVMIRGDDRAGLDNWHLDLIKQGYLCFSFNAADNRSAGIGAPIQLGQWQHVVATFDHGTMNLHINGVLVAHTTTELRPVAVLDPSADAAIGIGNAGGRYYNMPFDGLIDEVRVYNRALSESEIAESLAR
jgi:hypothetical protein